MSAESRREFRIQKGYVVNAVGRSTKINSLFRLNVLASILRGGAEALSTG